MQSLRQASTRGTSRHSETPAAGLNAKSESQRFKHRNEVHIAGVLSADPEIRFTKTGKTVANFSVAVTYENKTSYHRCTAWEDKAEKLGEHFRKGDFVKLAGRLQTRSYEGKDGHKVWTTEVVAWNLSDGTTEKNAHGTEVSDADIPF